MKIRLKALLDQRGISSKEFAKLVGVSEQTISYAIHGKVTPSVAKLEDMAKVLNVPLWQFFEAPENISPPIQPEHTCPHCGKPIKITLE